MNFRITPRMIFLLFWDIAATYLAFYGASLLTVQQYPLFVSTESLFFVAILAVVNIAVFLVFRLYSGIWEYASVDEGVQLLAATALATFLGAIVDWLLFISGVDIRVPIRVFFVAWLLLFALVAGVRMSFRFRRRYGFAAHGGRAPKSKRPRTLIIGAGETGSLTIRRMVSGDYMGQGLPVAAVDDDPAKQGLRISGVKVMGTREDILTLVDRYDISQIAVAIPSATVADRRDIYAICKQTECTLLTLPDNIRDLRMDELDDVKLRHVDLADLLGRDEIILDTRLVSRHIAGKTVLVTGGGGSIGSELCRQLCTVAPQQLVILDMYENTTYLLKRELLERYDDIDIRIEIGSVTDTDCLKRVFSTYHPTAVFHAAAHKHVPLMEDCAIEAVRNNIFGTLNVARLADAYGVERFTFISTDKAVNPSSTMGATKRMGEMIIQYYAHTSKTVFSCVRFGNVLGSAGSVVPIFKAQIAEGGPVTVTHPDMMRYFMTIPEASRLVITSAALAKGGEVFILDMGEPVHIVDLAKNLIRLAGMRPGEDIEIKYIGLRPGEKLVEELLMSTESTIPTPNPSITVSVSDEVSYEEVEGKMRLLSDAIDLDDIDNESMKQVLAEAVTTYQPQGIDR